MAAQGRLARWYHGLFHVAQATMHDRWVKRLRLVAFLAASSIATQVVLRNVLGYVGLSNPLPSSMLTILVASAVWLVAYPAMWLRMLTVMAEMGAGREYAALLRELEKLPRRQTTSEPPPEAARVSRPGQ